MLNIFESVKNLSSSMIWTQIIWILNAQLYSESGIFSRICTARISALLHLGVLDVDKISSKTAMITVKADVATAIIESTQTKNKKKQKQKHLPRRAMTI